MKSVKCGIKSLIAAMAMGVQILFGHLPVWGITVEFKELIPY